MWDEIPADETDTDESSSDDDVLDKDYLPAGDEVDVSEPQEIPVVNEIDVSESQEIPVVTTEKPKSKGKTRKEVSTTGRKKDKTVAQLELEFRRAVTKAFVTRATSPKVGRPRSTTPVPPK